MHRRALSIFLLLFLSVWFGAIVPGHQRGMIRLVAAGASVDAAGVNAAGVNAAGVASASIDDSHLPPCHRKKAPAKSDSPADAPRQSGGCVICLLAASIAPAAPPISVPSPVYAEPAIEVAAPAVIEIHILLPFTERGPPLA